MKPIIESVGPYCHEQVTSKFNIAASNGSSEYLNFLIDEIALKEVWTNEVKIFIFPLIIPSVVKTLTILFKKYLFYKKYQKKLEIFYFGLMILFWISMLLELHRVMLLNILNNCR